MRQTQKVFSVTVNGVVLAEQSSSRALTHAVVARLAPRFGPKGRGLRVLCFNGSKARAVYEARVAWKSGLYRDIRVLPVTAAGAPPGGMTVNRTQILARQLRTTTRRGARR